MTEDAVGSETADERFDVVVIGGGVAGLVAAREFAHKGLTVVLFEESETFGGFVGRHEVAGIALDSGAESFATRGGAKGKPGPVATLLDDLELGDRICSPNAAGAWVQLPDAAAPLPKLTLLGIPGVPLADDVRRIIGWRSAIRAQLDRYQPLIRVRKETDLGGIVRRRMGQRVLDRLVTPIVAGVHSASPNVVDVHAVAPGLTAAMTTQGSLSGAVLSLLAERDTKAAAGSAVAGLRGGIFGLVEALVADCRHYGVELRLGARADAVERREGGWRTTVLAPGATPGDAERAAGRVAAAVADGPLDQARSASAESGEPVAIVIDSRAVVVATSFRSGLRLVSGVGVDTGPESAWPEPASVELATLVIDDARLDSAPRGTGVLVAKDVTGVRAKALTHATVKWPWLAESAGPGRHVLRLSYDRHDSGDQAPSVLAPTSTRAATPRGAAPPPPPPPPAAALGAARALLGIALDADAVAGFAVKRWDDALAFATVGHRARVTALLERSAEFDGLAIVGAWVAGTGLASTVGQARTVASALAMALHTAR
jgi:oxygen-dependent protoporphyrinogen oxidase